MTADADEDGDGQDPGRAQSAWQRPVLIAGAIAVLVAVAVSVGLPSDDSTGLVAVGEDGDPAPEFSLPSLTDEKATIALSDFDGVPVVVNFWASWCVPCRREMPALEAVHQQFAGRVAFVGVNHQDQRDDALELIAETGTSYPSVHDPTGEVAVAYELFGMPTTVFITADRRIAGRHTGELTEADLRSALDELTSAT